MNTYTQAKTLCLPASLIAPSGMEVCVTRLHCGLRDLLAEFGGLTKTRVCEPPNSVAVHGKNTDSCGQVEGRRKIAEGEVNLRITWSCGRIRKIMDTNKAT